MRQQGEWFDLWGKIDPEEVEAFEDKGVYIKLYRINKAEQKAIKDIEGLTVIKNDKDFIYATFITDSPGEELQYEQVALPDVSATALAKDLKEKETKLEEEEKLFRNSTIYEDSLIVLRDHYLQELGFLEVRAGMQKEKAFACLRGFFPEKREKTITKLIEKHALGYMIQDPEDNKEVPTSITNPKWIDIVKPVFTFMNTVPGYDEYDISLVFLIFFSLFFAMLVGDAGYGTLFLLITAVVQKKFKQIPKQPLFLMYLLGGATFVWGAITGTWFGAESIAKLPVFNLFVIDRINSFATTNQDFMMYLCFIIGAVHLTIAHITKMIRVINSPVALAQAGWISIVWGMFYAAGTLVIAKPFPSFAGYLLGAGMFLVLIFANFQKNIIKGILSTLADLPLSVIGAFSDVVSYLRLFAVGYASVVVAQSFNNMAIGDGITSIFGGIAAALILFAGHALNITLALMAVIVHGIRLNMLEFSGHLGMQWSGKDYKPFSE
jgi:V/A-type H+/Na+-transporting ATPase subunit I